jgi:hypothetical protein
MKLQLDTRGTQRRVITVIAWNTDHLLLLTVTTSHIKEVVRFTFKYGSHKLSKLSWKHHQSARWDPRI